MSVCFLTHTLWNSRIERIRRLILWDLGGGFLEPFWNRPGGAVLIELLLAGFGAGCDSGSKPSCFAQPAGFDGPFTDYAFRVLWPHANQDL